MIPAALIALAVLFELRRAVSHGLQLGTSEFLFDKWHLGSAAPARFRGGGDAVDLLAICLEAAGDPAARHDGPIFAAGVLRAPAVLLRGTHAHGQCVDAERVAAIRAVEQTFAAMLVTAKLFSKSEAKYERQPKTGIPSGPGTQTNSPAQSEAARSGVAPVARQNLKRLTMGVK